MGRCSASLPVAIDDDTLVVCFRFRVVERLADAGASSPGA